MAQKNIGLKTFGDKKITVREFKKSDVGRDTELTNVELTDVLILTIDGMFDTAQAEEGDKFWIYDPFTANCQDFILNLLGTSHLLTPELLDFVKQDASSIGKELQKSILPVNEFARGVTDIAARFRRLTGTGLYNGRWD